MAKYAETGFTKSYCSNGSEASSEKQKIFKRLKQNGSESMGRYVDEIYGLERETTGEC